MIVFRDDFIKVPRFPGYFWSLTEKRLYSIKVSGVLTPLAVHKGWQQRNVLPGYRVSKDGRKYSIPLIYLNKLTQPQDTQSVDIRCA